MKNDADQRIRIRKLCPVGSFGKIRLAPDTNAEWDVDLALFPARIHAFLQQAQPRLWKDMHALHGDGLEDMLIKALAKELQIKGTLHILRHGFKFYRKTFRLAYFRPAHGLNDEVLALYAKIQLTVTRSATMRTQNPLYHSTGPAGVFLAERKLIEQE